MDLLNRLVRWVQIEICEHNNNYSFRVESDEARLPPLRRVLRRLGSTDPIDSIVLSSSRAHCSHYSPVTRLHLIATGKQIALDKFNCTKITVSESQVRTLSSLLLEGRTIDRPAVSTLEQASPNRFKQVQRDPSRSF